MKSIVLFSLLTFLVVSATFGQIKIGDNPQNIDAASVLELESNSKVLVITRVTTLEMDAIVPQRGGMVYNTDTACIHYYDGGQWVNLCDAVSFSLTNDPIENVTSTISIVDNGGTINLEVAQNSIRSENIVDGGINGDDIQDNSIGESKLGDDSVSSNELRDNSVTSSEIRDGSIQPLDIADTNADQVLTTDENGKVQWEDASNLTTDVVLDVATNAADIADHIADDGDTDDRNELTDISFDKITNILSLSNSETVVGQTTDLSSLVGSDDQSIEEFSFNSGNGTLTLTLEEGGTEVVNLGSLNAVEVDGIIGNEITNAADGTLIRSGNGTAGNPYLIDVSTGGIDTPELANNSVNNAKLANNSVQTVNIVNGTITTADIAPSAAAPANIQILTTNTGGNVEWIDIPAGAAEIDGIVGNEITNVADASLIRSGNGIAGDPYLIDVNVGGIDTPELADEAVTNLKLGTNSVQTGNILDGTIAPIDIAPAGPAPANIQILSTSTTGDVEWIDIPVGGTGSTELADQVTITGDGTVGNEFKVEAISTTEITNATILPEDIAPFAPAPTNTQILTTSTTGIVEWVDLPVGTGGNPTATDVDFNPYLSINATNAQAAIEELKDELDATIIGGGGNPTDELQDLSLATNILTLSNPATTGNQVDLTLYLDNTDAQNAGEVPVTLTPTNYTVGTADVESHLAGINAALGTVGGEDNTASNNGTAGQGLFLQKIGADLEFKNINAASNRISVTNDAANNEVDIDVVEANLTITESQISDLAHTVDTQIDAAGITGLGFVAGAHTVNTDNQNAAAVPFSPTGNTTSADVQAAIVELQTDIDGISSGGEVNTASNNGTAGEGIFLQKTGADLEFKNINAASNKVSVTNDATNNEVDIDVVEANLTITESQISDLVHTVNTDNQNATAVPFSPTGNTTSADVQAAIVELQTDIDGISAGNNLSNTNLTQTETVRTYEIGTGESLVFTGLGSIGFGNGANPPLSKFHFAGEIRSQGFNSSFGTEGSPAFSFVSGATTDSDTGMYRIAADELGFSVGGNLALTIDEPRTGVTNVTVNGSFSTNIRTETGTGTILIAEDDYTIIVSNATDVDLPAPANTGLGLNTGKIYIIKNITGAQINISSYVNADGSNITETILPMGILKLQSDGTNWHQIN